LRSVKSDEYATGYVSSKRDCGPMASQTLDAPFTARKSLARTRLPALALPVESAPPFLDSLEVTPPAPSRFGCPHGLSSWRQESGAFVFLPCRGRTCESAWCRRAWVREHRGRIEYGLRMASRKPYLLTMTAPPVLPEGFESWADWNVTVPDRYEAALRGLVRAGFLRPDRAYSRVWELHRERGGKGRPLHSHTIVIGWIRGDLEVVRALLVGCGFGRQFNVKPVYSVGGMAGYMAGYLTKSHEYMGHRRVVSYSRNWPREVEDPDALAHRRYVNVLDPLLPLIRPSESWVRWAERVTEPTRRRDGSWRLAEASRGGPWVIPQGDAFAYVRPPNGAALLLFPDLPPTSEDP